MPNPFEAPSTPITLTADQSPIEGSMVIDSIKGQITLEKRCDSFVLLFKGEEKAVSKNKFNSSIVLLFGNTKRITFKPFKLSTPVSDEKFLELITLYGVDNFQSQDAKSSRPLNAFFSLLFFTVGIYGFQITTNEVLTNLIFLAMGVISFALLILSVTRFYLLQYLLNVLIYLFLGILLSFNLFVEGGWWAIILLFIAAVNIWNNWKRFLYFKKVG